MTPQPPQRKLGCLLAATAALLLVTSVTAAPVSIAPLRDDDNELDTWLDLDYVDDYAIKRIIVPAGILAVSPSPTLWVYGQADACGTAGSAQRLLVNGNAVADFNPCALWATAAFSWASFPVPLTTLNAGTNTFEIYEIAGDWADRNVLLGVDLDTDHGRSDIYQASSYFTGSIGGELMWYLAVT